MKKHLMKFINSSLSPTGYTLLKADTLKELLGNSQTAKEFSFLEKYPEGASKYLKYREKSKAQLRQDLFVLLELDFKRNGFFVEFGATDGVSLSNTFLLEKELDWKGILAEPGKIWHRELQKNRSCFIEKDCVWSTTGDSLFFNEVEAASLSTIEGFGKDDNHSEVRKIAKGYPVTTISLEDLLQKYNAPDVIDYISIDTEGSELVILENFNFNRYRFRVLTVEHNYTAIREPIYELLTSKGYTRVHEEYSEFDDWYIYNI